MDHLLVGGPVTAADAASDALGKGDGLEIRFAGVDVVEALLKVGLAIGGGVVLHTGPAAVELAVDGPNPHWLVVFGQLGSDVDAHFAEQSGLWPSVVTHFRAGVLRFHLLCDPAGPLAAGVDLLGQVRREFEELFV